MDRKQIAMDCINKTGAWRDVQEWRIFTKSLTTIIKDAYEEKYQVNVQSGDICLSTSCPSPGRAFDVSENFLMKISLIYGEIGWPCYETGIFVQKSK